MYVPAMAAYCICWLLPRGVLVDSAKEIPLAGLYREGAGKQRRNPVQQSIGTKEIKRRSEKTGRKCTETELLRVNLLVKASPESTSKTISYDFVLVGASVIVRVIWISVLNYIGPLV